MQHADIPKAYAIVSEVGSSRLNLIYIKSIVMYFLSKYLKNFDLAPIFTQEEFEYLCQSRPNIVSSFVVEVSFTSLHILHTKVHETFVYSFYQQENGDITDFISYYHLSSTIMNHPQYKTLNACYLYYHATSKTPLVDLVQDCIVQAHNVKLRTIFHVDLVLFRRDSVLFQNDFDVFNALDLLDNKSFLEKLKFGVGDGNLQYYIYNWKCPIMEPGKVRVHSDFIR